MDGISPRFVINRISTSLIKPDMHCINPIDVLRALKTVWSSRASSKKIDRECYTNLMPMRGANTMRLPAPMSAE